MAALKMIDWLSIECKGCGDVIGLRPYRDDTRMFSESSIEITVECPNCQQTHRYVAGDFKVAKGPDTGDSVALA